MRGIIHQLFWAHLAYFPTWLTKCTDARYLHQLGWAYWSRLLSNLTNKMYRCAVSPPTRVREHISPTLQPEQQNGQMRGISTNSGTWAHLAYFTTWIAKWTDTRYLHQLGWAYWSRLLSDLNSQMWADTSEQHSQHRHTQDRLDHKTPKM